MKHKKVEKVEEAHPTMIPGKPEKLMWNNKEFHIRDIMHDHVSGMMKDQVGHKAPIIIEVPGKPPMIEWNNEKHHIRDLMSKKFSNMIFQKSIGCQTDEIVEEIVEDNCKCHKCCFANR